MKTYSTQIGRLAAAVAALACAPAFAQSSVTLYGAVDDGVAYVNNQRGHSNVYLRQGNLYASKFGLQGKEDLGGGTRAIFDLQNGFDLNTGALSSAGLMFNRQAYVGLQNDRIGTLTAGRQYTPYYMFVGPLTGSSWLTGATGAHPGDIDGLDTTVRINNSLVYTSPSWGGLQASAMYALGGIAGSTGKGQTYSGALRYMTGPVTLSLGYLRMDNAQQTTGFDPASTGSFGTSALNAGYVSAKAIQHIAAAGNYTLGNLVFERRVSGRLAFAVRLDGGFQYLRCACELSVHARVRRRCRRCIHGSIEGQRHQQCRALSAVFAQGGVSPVQAHDDLCAAGVSARYRTDARQRRDGKHHRRGALGRRFAKRNAFVDSFPVRRHGRDCAVVLIFRAFWRMKDFLTWV
jgi:predicted porin